MRFAILGGGPAGYAAASTAADLGAEVTIVDRRTLGGNWTTTDGIPSKTLLHTSQVMAAVQSAEDVGIQFEHGRPRVDLQRTIAHARWVAAHQARGVRERLDAVDARILFGSGRIAGDGLLAVETEAGPREVEFDALLVATGAGPWEPPFAAVDHERILNTRDVLDLQVFPEHLLVVGAGATGCEFAEFFASCGVRVTLLSSRQQILPSEDRDLADVVHEAFLARGTQIALDARAKSVEPDDGGVLVTAGDDRRWVGSHAIICMGMRAETSALGLAEAGVELGPRGEIAVDEFCR